MATYKPMGTRELQSLLQQAAEDHIDILTRHQRQNGMGLDFQYFNEIREIDVENLTVTAERGVLLGNLEEAVNAKGLHVSFYTPDLQTIRLGDFFAEQMLSLTSLHHNQPRFQVLGTEIMLVDGTLVKTGGKTMKNVTGYDMCRFTISNRETMTIPIAFTLKLSSREDEEEMLSVDIPNPKVLRPLVRALRETNTKPKVCLYWNEIANRQITLEKQGRLIIVLSGSRERVRRDLELVENLLSELNLNGEKISATVEVWKQIRRLRMETGWMNGLKIPSLQCVEIMEELAERRIGMWYSIMEGNLQLMPEEQSTDGIVYRSLCKKAELLGGAGNRYLQYLYQLGPVQETKLWAKLKQQYDPEGRLNPTMGGAGRGIGEK